MKRCYEFYILKETVTESDGRTSSSRLFTEIHPDAEETVEQLLAKHDRNSWEFFGNIDVSFRQDGLWPWAIVFYEEEYRIAGHVVALRQNRTDFSFTALSLKPGCYSIAEQGVPPVGVLFINRKSALEAAALQSELFKKAWEQLAEMPENRHWICIAESP